jgi:hypothetical protein
MSASCSDDSSNGFLIDDPRFFITGASTTITRGIPHFSSVGDIFSEDVFSDESVFSSHAQVKRPLVLTCLNCMCPVYELVFKCGCSVECALGFHTKNPSVYNLIIARYYLVPGYQKLSHPPKPLLSIEAGATQDQLLNKYSNELYQPDDLRKAVYSRQILRNTLSSSRIRR